MADITGIDKIIRHIQRYDVRKIKLSKGSDTVFLARIKPGQDMDALVREFNDWVDDFIDSGNFANYKLQLFGTDKEDDGKTPLSLITSTTVAFNDRGTVTGNRPDPHFRGAGLAPGIDLDKYVSLASENATLKAQLERMEEKMDEILAEDEDEDDDVGAVEQPRSIQEAISQALMGKIDTIVEIAIGALGSKFLPNAAAHPGIAGPGSNLEAIIDELQLLHPEIEADLARILQLRKTQPALFNGVINSLRQIIP